jgi:catechol 2,3-dioxygenase-like lactoylglutathione lyase family enzyme
MIGMAIEITGFQVNLFSEDIEACAEFYRQLGFEEFYRTPLEGLPEHVEVCSSGLTIGIASTRVANDEFGLGVVTGSNSAEVLLWCEDVDVAYAAALAAGGTPVHEPEDYQGGRVRHAWLTDPAGHLVELVELRRP